MASDPLRNNLLRSSVIVTGSHYSMTTLVGRLLAEAPEFHLLHEPANAEPTLSYDSLNPEHWYEFFDSSGDEALGQYLLDAMQAKGFSQQIFARVRRAHSFTHALQIVRYASRKLPLKLSRKPAIIKDPFLLFAAKGLQQAARMRVVLTVRHPCAFAESLKRAGKGFDFANLLQPQLLEAMPEEAAAIRDMAAAPADFVAQAALLWRILYGFAVRYLLPSDLTCAVRQDDIILSTDAAVDRLFCFAGGTRSAAVDRFIVKNLSAGATDFGRGKPYIRRDGRATLDKWRVRLSPNEVATVREATEEVAAHFGYGHDSWMLRRKSPEAIKQFDPH